MGLKGFAQLRTVEFAAELLWNIGRKQLEKAYYRFQDPRNTHRLHSARDAAGPVTSPAEQR